MKPKKLILTVIILAVVAASIWLLRSHWSQGRVVINYRTQAVINSQLRIAVGATGTINPVMVVNVGTQISGTIKELYVDFNDTVTAGQLLMVIDDQLFKAKTDMSQANLANSRAQLKLAQLKFDRQENLFKTKTSTKEEYDTAQANLEMAKAMVAQQEASLAQDLYNLNNTRITSPVDGVVINRGVDIGQTVAASFQTPTLINIAGDLTKMQINASFAEADIGSLVPGLETVFTVDAFPGETFKGTLRQIRLNPTITSNVVTYDVVIDVKNQDRKLLPGMTAYVDIELYREDNVMLIPNSALNYRPSNTSPDSFSGSAFPPANGSLSGQTPGGHDQPSSSDNTSTVPNSDSAQGQPQRRPRQSAETPSSEPASSPTSKEAVTYGTVYVQNYDGSAKRVELTLGATDLRYTVVKSGDLKIGDFVIVGELLPDADRTLISGTGMGPGRAPRR
ncbi:MAG: efflux RND transporter periplasmic adaptor subunit [Deltaproteobacteria bacterium]|jgi:HlyD family secretion protein|nr:efflux RND transporter periplasmic adaptor subunit [Deltaproteobacteria bacterium]